MFLIYIVTMMIFNWGIKIFQKNLLGLRSPKNLSFLWNFGSILGIILAFQIIRGLILTLFYTNDVRQSFYRIEIIERLFLERNLSRLWHVRGVNWFFILIYSHILRGLFYSSFLNDETWNRGVRIYILLMGVAFLGYVLPWGQISIWGATVITNLFRVIPLFGDLFVKWIWWGFAINNLTLKLFFRLHFSLPFLILVLVLVHLVALHFFGSSSKNLKRLGGRDKVKFDPLFTWKDFLTLRMLFRVILLFKGVLWLDPENYLEANEITSPLHIKPEWYFLYVYAILRSIPQKSIGVLALALALISLYLLSLRPKRIRVKRFRLVNKVLIRVFLISGVLLTWIGGMPVETPFVFWGQAMTLLYFLSLFGLYLCIELNLKLWF